MDKDVIFLQQLGQSISHVPVTPQPGYVAGADDQRNVVFFNLVARLVTILDNEPTVWDEIAKLIETNPTVYGALADLIAHNATIIEALTQTIVHNSAITASVREAAKGQLSVVISRPKEAQTEYLFKATYPTVILTSPTMQVMTGAVSNPGFSHGLNAVLQPGDLFTVTPTGVTSGSKNAIVSLGLTLYTPPSP